MVDGATVVGIDLLLFNPWTHGFFTSWYYVEDTQIAFLNVRIWANYQLSSVELQLRSIYLVHIPCSDRAASILQRIV